MQENVKQVIVKMTARRCFRTEPIYQYDVGHELVFDGFELPATFEVHFSLSPMGKSITQVGQNGVCVLPDMYAQTAAPIYAWLYIADEETGLTKYSIEIPVQRRAKPTDQQPTPVQQSAIDQAIAALNAGAEAAEDAQEAAEAAQTGAETAQGQAEDAATRAANSAIDADSSRRFADQSATEAQVAQGKAETAQTKAETAQGKAEAAQAAAEAAVGSYDAMTATATTLQPGSSATAEIDRTGDHPVLQLGLPQGEAGATPDFSIGTVSTLQPGQDATATITGTAAAPVLNLGIPQGDPGDATIDDTAGVGDTTKVWSADKSATERNSLLSALNAIEDEVYTDGTGSLANAYTGTTGGTTINNTYGFHLPGIYSDSIEFIPFINKTEGQYIAERFYSESGTFDTDDPLTLVESKTANIGESVTFSDVTPNDFFAINVHSISGEIRFSNATTPAHDVPFGRAYNRTGNPTGPFVYRTVSGAPYFAAEKLDITVKESAIDKKLDSNQGTENAGKVLAVNNEGNVVPVDMPVPEVDATLTVEGEAADAKAVGDVLLDKPIGPELVWNRGYTINANGEVVTSSNTNAVSDGYIESEETKVLYIGRKNYPTDPGSLSVFIYFDTYESDGTFVSYQYWGLGNLKTESWDCIARNLLSGYKYKFHLAISNPGTYTYEEILDMLDIHWKVLTPDKTGLVHRVADLETDNQRIDQLETDVDGGGEKIAFFIEKGGISASTGADNTAHDSSVYGRTVGYYAADDNIVVSVPVGGRCVAYEYSGESAEDFIRCIGPSNTDGITYVSSPYTVEITPGYYYRFILKLNDSYAWQDGQEFFKDFTFVKQSTMVEGLKDRVTALEQESGSDKLFTGKTCVTLGDSITYRNVWQPIVNDALGMTMVNKGIGSTALSGGDTNTSSMSSDTRLNGVLAENPDYVTILGGANDLYSNDHPAGYPIGDESEFEKTLSNKNRQTFLGAYSYIIEYLLGHDPTLSIMILGTTWAHSDGTRFSETLTYTDYSNASKKVAQYYGLPFVDLHGECGFNAFTMGSASANQIYASDQIHPNAEGGKRIASLVIAKMIEAWKYTI